MSNKKRDEISQKILKRLDEMERRMSWLSRKTDIPYGTLYSSLVQKVCLLSESNLEKISEVLDISLTIK
jgi:predicted transcriptional regulator